MKMRKMIIDDKKVEGGIGSSLTSRLGLRVFLRDFLDKTNYKLIATKGIGFHCN